ncbi:MAG: hypothetical protein WAU01_03205 [Saprospiraceae bacterium]
MLLEDSGDSLNKENPARVIDSISLFIAFLIYVVGTLARMGLNDELNVLPLLFSISILLLPRALSAVSNLPRALSQILILVLFFLVGWLSIFTDLKFSFIIYPAAFFSIFFYLRQFNRSKSQLGFIGLLLVFLIGLKIISILWTTNYYLDPLAPEYFPLGRFHIDTLYLTNITSLIKTYQVTSTGLFGLVPIEYHAGSNYVFAAFGSLCEVSSMRFYNSTYAVLFIPLFVQSFFYAAFSNLRKEPNKFRIITSLLIFFFVLSGFVSNPIGQKYLALSYLNNHFLSESYCLSLILLFLFISLYSPFLSSIQRNSKKEVNPYLILLIPVWIMLIGYTKVSTGIILYSLFFYVVLRIKYLNGKAIKLSLLLSTIAILVTVFLTVESNRNETFLIQFGSFYRYYVEGNLFVYFLLNYCWLFFFIITYVFLFKIKRSSGLWKKNMYEEIGELVREKKTEQALQRIELLKQNKRAVNSMSITYNEFISGKYILPEVIIFAAVIGILPGLLIEIEGGSAAYFADVQSWLSIIALIHFFPFLLKKFFDRYRQNKKLVWALFIILSFYFVRESVFRGAYFFIKQNVESRADLMYGERYPFQPNGLNFKGGKLSGSGMRSIFKSSLAPYSSPLFREQIQGLNLPLLEELRGLPIQVKRNSLIFCEDPESLPKFKDCSEAFYIQAVTEIAMINGLYWKGCLPSGEYSWRYYSELPAEINKEEAYLLAKDKGFLNIIVVNLKENRYKVDAL